MITETRVVRGRTFQRRTETKAIGLKLFLGDKQRLEQIPDWQDKVRKILHKFINEYEK